MKDEIYIDAINCEYEKIIVLLQGGYIYGEPIDFDNKQEVVVAMYHLMVLKALDDKLDMWKARFYLGE